MPVYLGTPENRIVVPPGCLFGKSYDSEGTPDCYLQTITKADLV